MTKRKSSKRTAQAGQSIAFELFAPYNEAVALVGSWNNWEQPAVMERSDDGVWRTQVTLPDGEFEYQFQLVSRSNGLNGETIRVADPTAIQFGSHSDTADTTLLKVVDGKCVISTYEWQHDDVPLPPNNELIIYEVHIGDFRGGQGDTDEAEGKFQRVIDKLDYLTDLGVNAIQLMPVNETPAGNYWGYSQRSIYAVENTYGTPDDLCRLVDECHARGLRVIYDAVFNHVDVDSPLAQMDYTYWFYEQNPDEAQLHYGPKFNYEYYDEKLGIWPAREHVIGAIRLWVSEFHIDGIRFDSTRALRYFDLLRWFNGEAHQRTGFKPFFTIAEHLPQDPAITGPEGPIDAAWHDNYYRQMASTILGVSRDGRQPFLTGEVLRLADARSDGFASSYNTVHYLNNHDQERMMYLLGAEANTFDDAAFRRAKLGTSLLLTSPGIPMLWMGEEFGQAPPKSEGRQPLHWALLENERNRDLWTHYRKLIDLRKNNPALHSEHFETLADLPGRGVIAYKRWNDEGNIVVVAANLSHQYAGEVEIALPGIEDGRWREAIFNYEVETRDNRLVDTLTESEVKVYVKC